MNNKLSPPFLLFLLLGGLYPYAPLHAMGLRSFVALPVETGGVVARITYQTSQQTDMDDAMVHLAYGIDRRLTLLSGTGYQVVPTNSAQWRDASLLLRYTVVQHDEHNATNRTAILGGMIVPTSAERNGGWQFGAVNSTVFDRHEVDIDALYIAGNGSRLNTARYDVSWQYRLFPQRYPDWGLASALNSVLELNGRWQEDEKIDHQLTAGLQWTHAKWVIEGGVFSSLSHSSRETLLVSLRTHF